MKKLLHLTVFCLKQIMAKSCATVYLLFSSVFLFSQGNTWQYTGNNNGLSMISNRAYPVSFSIDGKGYIGTGRDDGDILSPHMKDFWEFNPNGNVWTQRADFGGHARSEATGFSIGNKGYAGFGRGSDFPFNYDDFWEYNPVTNTWVQKASLIPAGGLPRTRAAGFSIGNKGYLGTGGFSIPVHEFFSVVTFILQTNPILSSILNSLIPGVDAKLIDFWEFNPATNQWTRKSDFSGSARDAAVGFSIGDKGYFGTGGLRDDFWEYYPVNNTWTQKANVGIGATTVNSGFSLGSRGYICSEHSFREYDPNNNTWTARANFPGPGIAAATGFSIGNKGYIGFGETDERYFLTNYPKPTNQMFEYSPVPYINTFVSALSVATGYHLQVTFDAVGNFGTGNTFTAQLSNASGSFASPVIIGSTSSGNTFSVTIPCTTPVGSGYRIRVVSSNPVITGNDNGMNITVRKDVPFFRCPRNIVIPNTPGTCGRVVNYNPPEIYDDCFTCSAPTSIPGYTFLGVLNGHSYFRSNFNATWEAANTAAQSLGAHLVTLSNETENNFVTGNGNQAWIGLTDKTSEGNFAWVTNEPPGYGNWFAGEPNDYGGNEDYIVTNFYYTGQWNDYGPWNTFPFIVEFDCGSFVTQTSGLASGSVFPVGVTYNSFSYTSPGGTPVTCGFIVTVLDNQPPVLTCPPNIVTTATGVNGAQVNYNLPAVSDNCPSCFVPSSIPDYTLLGVFLGHTYFRSNFSTTWEAANNAAQGLGAHLVTLTNASENSFVTGNGNQAWIGLTDKTSEGNFAWVTGEPFFYNNWFAGEPNNYGGNEDYVVTNFYYTGQWNDYGPWNIFPFIIEFDCASSLTQTSGLASGSVFPIGVTTNTFTYTDQGGNTATCSFTVTVVPETLTLAKSDKTVPEKTMVAKAYPNPSAGDFNLEVMSNSEERVMVRVLDITGVVKSVQYLNTKIRTLKLGADLPGGTYMVEVTQGANKQVLKLVKLN